MTKPLPWSHSALECFENCPRMYHGRYVTKQFKDAPQTDAQIWGERVHKHFEERQNDGVVLSPELSAHEPFMQKLQEKPGHFFTEQKIGLDRQLQPCHFFAKDVWFRGIIDYLKVDGNKAFIVDYKTGKPHNKFNQLRLFAIHTFALFPNVALCNVQYYWTQTMDVTKKVFGRDEVPQLWSAFIPLLRQYVEAFKTDTWQPRPSGLCNGFCPDTSCEFWKPRKGK